MFNQLPSFNTQSKDSEQFPVQKKKSQHVLIPCSLQNFPKRAMRAHLYIIPKSANDPKSTKGLNMATSSHPPFIWSNDNKILKVFKKIILQDSIWAKQMQASNLKPVTQKFIPRLFIPRPYYWLLQYLAGLWTGRVIRIILQGILRIQVRRISDSWVREIARWGRRKNSLWWKWQW